jgi:hypothetical protein
MRCLQPNMQAELAQQPMRTLGCVSLLASPRAVVMRHSGPSNQSPGNAETLSYAPDRCLNLANPIARLL